MFYDKWGRVWFIYGWAWEHYYYASRLHWRSNTYIPSDDRYQEYPNVVLIPTFHDDTFVCPD